MAVNLLYYNPDDGSLVKADQTGLAEIADFVLERMASGTYAGSLQVGQGVGNPIGNFVDRARRGGAGDSDINVLETTYTISQNTDVVSTDDPPTYLGVDDSDPSTVVIQESITSIDDLADEVLSRMVDEDGPNSYFLGETAPNDGGTWESLGEILDTVENFQVINKSYRLWHKVGSNAVGPNPKRPLKLSANGNIELFSDNDLDRVIKKVEERISTTGIGSYAVQSTAPSVGTWVSAGQITDVVREVIGQSYIGEYTSNYTGSEGYVGSYTGTDTFTRTYFGTTTYFGSRSVSYTGSYIRLFFGGSGSYTGLVPFFSDGYTSYSRSIAYFTVRDTAFAGTYTATYYGSSTSSGSFSRSYTGSRGYTGSYTGSTFSSQTFDGSYGSPVISDSVTEVQTITLWKRIA